jgi:AbrB family looped-hinge helix DNA binding protein
MGVFRVKIGAKRQITLPQLLMDHLRLKEGDELEFAIAEGKIQAVRPFKLIPLEYFDAETLNVLNLRAAQIANGEYEKSETDADKNELTSATYQQNIKASV